jgi:hypothetical protein
MIIPIENGLSSKECSKKIAFGANFILRSIALFAVFICMGGSALAASSVEGLEVSLVSPAQSILMDAHQLLGEHMYETITSSLDAYDRLIANAGEETAFLISQTPNPSLVISNALTTFAEQSLLVYKKGISSYVYIAPAIPSNFLHNISALGAATGNLFSAAASLSSYSLIERIAVGTYQVIHNFFSGIGDTVGILFVPASLSEGSKTP